MQLTHLMVGPLQACCYLVAPDHGALAAVVDPGGDEELVGEHLRTLGVAPSLLLLTHGHIDHIGAVAGLKQAYPDAEVCVHEADAPMLRDPGSALASLIGLPLEPVEADRFLADGDRLALGPMEFEVIHTPGHTLGGISFLAREADRPPVLFSGDTLFAGGIGRTDFPGGSYRQLLDSIRRRLFAFPDDTPVYPGHGEPTTIGQERRTNPFLQ